MHVGVPSTFIRTSGCNLRCWFCDTPYTSWEPEGSEWSFDALLQEVIAGGNEHVVITGGEPMLVGELSAFTTQVKALGKVITIETAGTVYQQLEADLLSISPKRANSTPLGTAWANRHESRRHRLDVLARLMAEYSYQLKFVIDQPGDVDDVLVFLNEFPGIDPQRVYLMAQGTDVQSLKAREQWMRPLAVRNNWNVTPRLHIERFGNRRGT